MIPSNLSISVCKLRRPTWKTRNEQQKGAYYRHCQFEGNFQRAVGQEESLHVGCSFPELSVKGIALSRIYGDIVLRQLSQCCLTMYTDYGFRWNRSRKDRSRSVF